MHSLEAANSASVFPDPALFAATSAALVRGRSKKLFLDIHSFDMINRLLVTGPLFRPDCSHTQLYLEVFRFVARTNKAASTGFVCLP